MDFACLLDDDDVSTVPLTLSGSGVGRASRVRASRRRLDFPLDDALLAHELTVGMLGRSHVGMLGREAFAFVLPEGEDFVALTRPCADVGPQGDGPSFLKSGRRGPRHVSAEVGLPD